MYYSDNDFRLYHSWGKSPAQKAREKEYNAWYYRTHKDKWRQYRQNRDVLGAIGEGAREVAGRITGQSYKNMMADTGRDKIRAGKYAGTGNTMRGRMASTARYARASVSYDAAYQLWRNHPVTRAKLAIARGRNAINKLINNIKTGVRNLANRAEWAGRNAVNNAKKAYQTSGYSKRSRTLSSQSDAYNRGRGVYSNRVRK